jgi:outer membrane protein TolC
LSENFFLKRRRRRLQALAFILAGCLLTAFSTQLSAQVSLSVAVDMAQRNSNAVKMAQADVQKATATLHQVLDAYIPNFSMSSTVGYSHGFPTGEPSIFSASMQSVVLSFSQRQYIKSARVGIDAANLKLKDAREQVALDTSAAYVELDTISREMEAAEQQKTLAARLVEIERQRAEAGVDPVSELLQAQLTSAQLKLKYMHLANRADILAKQIAVLTGLPVASVRTNQDSIPEIPAVTASDPSLALPRVKAAGKLAESKRYEAKGDDLLWRRMQVGFGAVYNYDSNKLNSYSTYYKNFTPNNVSFGFQITVPFFDFSLRAKARQTAAEALRATVEAEEAQRQDEIEIVSLGNSLRELAIQAEIASLKQQIAEEQLHAVLAQLELGSGNSSEEGSQQQQQVTPKAEQLARIDASQKYVESLEASMDLSKTRLNLLRALGHMEDWINLLHTK